MKRYIRSSMTPDQCSDKEKEQIARELFTVVDSYFYNEGHGTPRPRVTYSQYDIKEYTFRINSGTYSSDVRFVANADGGYKSIDINAFKAECRNVLKAHGFKKAAFDLKTEKRKGDQNTGYYSYTEPVYTYKVFVAIYFAV